MPLTLPAGGTPELPVVSSADWELSNAMMSHGSANSASAVYPTAGLGLFTPFRLSQRRTYVRAWWLNGTAVMTGTPVDLGVYTISGTTATKLQSIGATAQTGTSAMQTVTISWTFDPGLYYLAFSHSEAVTGQYWRGVPNAFVGRTMALFQAASQSPLTASPTVVAWATAYMPFFGLAEQSVV